jgi:glutathione peroxidase-family protein
VVLAVNVASKCGFTQSNYKQLVDLADRYQHKGLEIMLFPCNQFKSQEPGTSQEVCSFIQGYSDKFVVTEKVDVNGNNAHEIFNYLKKKCPGTITNAIKWNFTKVTMANPN